MKKIHIVLLWFLPILVGVLSLFIGRYRVDFSQMFNFLLSGFGLRDGYSAGQSITVVLQLRLPRIIAAAFVGAGLAASGAAYQGVFHNPLVSASFLGVSAGASFGAALAIVLFSMQWLTYPFAFFFGMLAVVLSYWIARIYKTVPAIMLVLGGTIVSSIFNALVSLLKYMADAERQLPQIVYWLMGSVSSVRYGDFWALVPILIGIVILIFYSWKINVLSMGDKEARAMGVNVKTTKVIIIAGATLATAGAVCLSGTVGWVGLVIPHIGRMLAGNDNRLLIPLAISLGATFMIVIDTLSRTIVSSEIPLGILTALIGAPFFIFLLKKTKGGGWQ